MFGKYRNNLRILNTIEKYKILDTKREKKRKREKKNVSRYKF